VGDKALHGGERGGSYDAIVQGNGADLSELGSPVRLKEIGAALLLNQGGYISSYLLSSLALD
jgi:hypothetical protein